MFIFLYNEPIYYSTILQIFTIYSFNMMMMFETSKHVSKTEKHCCVFKDNCFIFANKTVL